MLGGLKIVELDDGKFQMVVVVYNWVVANYETFMTIAKHDDFKSV
jgi:hypothetical protein